MKTTLAFVAMIGTLTFFSSGVGALVPCVNAMNEGCAPLLWRSISIGERSGAGSADAVFAVISTASEWTTFWRTHSSRGDDSGDPAPPVNFDIEFVVALLDHQYTSSGFNIEVTHVDLGSTGTVVEFRRSGPAEGEVVLPVITNPYHFVAILKTVPGAPVGFFEAEKP